MARTLSLLVVKPGAAMALLAIINNGIAPWRRPDAEVALQQSSEHGPHFDEAAFPHVLPHQAQLTKIMTSIQLADSYVLLSAYSCRPSIPSERQAR